MLKLAIHGTEARRTAALELIALRQMRRERGLSCKRAVLMKRFEHRTYSRAIEAMDAGFNSDALTLFAISEAAAGLN